MHMHGKKDEFVHKTITVFSKDKDYTYFICDPPHLIRNCLASSKRHLWVSDVLRLYVQYSKYFSAVEVISDGVILSSYVIGIVVQLHPLQVCHL